MPKPFRHKGGNALKVERFFFANTEKDCGRAKVLTVEDFIFGVGDVVFGALGDVGLDVGQDVAAATGFPCIFSGEIKNAEKT